MKNFDYIYAYVIGCEVDSRGEVVRYVGKPSEKTNATSAGNFAVIKTLSSSNRFENLSSAHIVKRLSRKRCNRGASLVLLMPVLRHRQLIKFVCKRRRSIMTKRKKAAIIGIGMFGFILIGLISAYFIYGSTLLNGYSEETIIKELSEDTDNPIEILAMQKYEDHLGILYKDPTAEDPLTEQMWRIMLFAHYIKHRLYKNRYYYKGGSPGGNVTCPLTSALVEDIAGSVFCI